MRWIQVAVAAVVVSMAISCGYESTIGDDTGRVPTTLDAAGAPTSTDVGDGTPSSVPATVAVDESVPPSTLAPTTTAVVTTTTAPPRVQTTPAGAVRVVEVIDGDTLKITGGQSVRLIGIDTPERGQCGYTEAAFVLASLIHDRPVVLVSGARTDTDRYGRLLRYVEVDGVDVNLEMIRSGRAIARYDSRDGYGRHPREDLYVSTDASTPSTNNCTPAPGGAKSGGGSGGAKSGGAPGGGTSSGGTDPRFGTCKAAKAAGYGGYVRGVDPEYEWYRDGDGDGIACE